MKKSWLDKYAKNGKVDYWDELSKAKYGQNMLNMTDEQIAMVRDTNRVTDDPLMIPGSPRVKAKDGAMIKRADGSYSKRGLWDNIRANAGSGKKPTKEMLKQEKKIRAAEKAKYGKRVKGLTKQQELQIAQSEQHLPYQDMDPAMVNLYQGVLKANDLFKNVAVNKKADLLYKRYNEQAGAYLSRPEYKNSPLKPEHIAEAAKRLYKDTNYEFPLDLALAQAQFESGLGTHLKTKNNVWNVGNYGDGTRTREFDSPAASAYNYMQLMYNKYLDKGKKNVDDLIQKGMINTEGNRYDPTNPKYEEVIGKQIKTIRKRVPGIGQPYSTTDKVSVNDQVPVQIPIAKDGKFVAPTTPYPDMDPAILKQYQLMQELSTAAGRGRVTKEKAATATKAKDKETKQYMMEKAAQKRAAEDPSMFSPSFWKEDPTTGRIATQRLEDMGTDLQTRVFQTGNKTYDSYLNAPAFTAHLAGNLAKAPAEAQRQNSIMPYVSAIGQPLLFGAGEAIAGPYIEKMFGKKPVIYGESNVAPHDPYSSMEKVKWPAAWQGPARTRKAVPLTSENAPYLTEVTPLTKEQEILKSFGLDPYKTKAEEELVSLYRVQPKGFDINSNTVAEMEKAATEGRLSPAQKIILNNPHQRKRLMDRDKFWGQWFEKDPNRLKFYIDDKGPESEILHLQVPKSQAESYTIKNFEPHGPESTISNKPLEYHEKMSIHPETEFIVPKDIIEKAQKYSVSDWQKLIDQHKAWGLLPAGFTLGALKSAMSQGDNKKYGGKINKNWLQNY